MTNKYFLKDGRNFCINPELEEVAHEARRLKKNFLLSVNPQDLKTDKLWNSEAIRALATGLVQSTTGKKRATKAELVERLVEYAEEDRKLTLVATKNILEELNTAGYETTSLLRMIATLKGTSLVDAIESSLLLGGYADTTITKTYLPDITKAINTHYEGEDKEDIKRSLHSRFVGMRKNVDKNSGAKVYDQSAARRPIKYHLLENFISELLQSPNELTWKEISICLAFATGRRCSEVHGVKTKFTIVDESTVLFEGQLKTKTRGEVPPYEIPTLIPSELVVKLFERLRELGRGEYTPEEVHSKLSKSLSTELPTKLKQVFHQVGVTKYKDLRDIYAAKMIESKPVEYTDTLWVALHMGHNDGDLSTAETYKKIRLVYE